MIKKVFLLGLLFALYSTSCLASGIENGKYEISFRISDMGFSQVIEIRNSTQNDEVSHYKFDVIINEKGSLSRFKDDNQIVKGIVYNGKFKMIIPYANVTGVDAYYFEGKNESKNGFFSGIGDVPYQGPNVGKNKFNFFLKKINP